MMKLLVTVAMLFSCCVVNCQAKNTSDKLLKSLTATANLWLKVTEEERLQKYTCPPSVPGIIRSELKCTSLLDCSDDEDELCCYWTETDTHHCLQGLSKDQQVHAGQCPTLTMYNDACLALYAGCQSDGDCGSTEKCCQGFCDDYKECLDIRQNIGCPIKLERGGNSCSDDTECRVREKCCGKGRKAKCVIGVSTIARPGYCPILSGSIPRNRRPSINNCRRAYRGDCNHDSECQGSEKCCRMNCNYNQCIDNIGMHTKELADDITSNDLNIDARESTVAEAGETGSSTNKELISLLMRALEKN